MRALSVVYLDFGPDKERTIRRQFEELARLLEQHRKAKAMGEFYDAYGKRHDKPGPEAA